MRLGRGENWERPQNPTKESLCLEEGETYIFLISESEETSPKKKLVKKKMKLVKCYKHHAVFESKKGIRQSYRYWDIEKLLLGQPR